MDRRLVSRAFLYFERLGFKRPGDRVNDRLAQEGLDELSESDWYELFCDVDPAIFEAACKKAAKRVRFWPKPADMMAAIDELLPKKDPYPKAALPTPRSRTTSPAVKRALELIHAQGFEAGRAAAPPCPIAAAYAAAHYPDLPADSIKRSEIELRELARDKERCEACKGRYKAEGQDEDTPRRTARSRAAGCPTGGYKLVGRPDRLTGYVMTSMAQCDGPYWG